MGQHEKELNPYWKDGGTGLPEEAKGKEKKASTTSSVAGDGGVSWLRKAYQRCVERAKEEGKSLEEIASVQYGVTFVCLFVYLLLLFYFSLKLAPTPKYYVL